MPLAPNWLERFFFLTLNQGPGPSLDMWGGPAFQVVLAAIRLNLFGALNLQPLTTADLSRHLQADPRATQLLLDALASLKYVKGRNGHYDLTAMTRKWLTDDGAINFSAYFQFWGAMMEHFMPRLEESLRTGQPPVYLYEWLEDQPGVSRYFQEGMMAITRYVKDDVVKGLPLPPNARRLLDIGGGHAMYSIALCQTYPQLLAVVFDGAQALSVGLESIADEGMADRVTVQEGDLLTDDLGTGYDVALVFNIVHGLTPEANLDLFRKIKASLNPGGQLVILEQLTGVAPLPLMDTVVHILSVSFFHVLGGQVYTFEDISGWLREAGFRDIRRKNILKVGGALINGTKYL
jgi:SAM-dependent methyltransferase